MAAWVLAAPRRTSHAPAWLWRAALLLALIVGVFYVRHHLVVETRHAPPRAQRIKLVSPPHAVAPPPRPRDEAPKEAPKASEKLTDTGGLQGRIALVESAVPGAPVGNGSGGADGPAALDDQLGMQGEGEGAGDSFGLVAKRGGHDITRLGGGGGISAERLRALYAGYGRTIAQRLQHELQGSVTVAGRDVVIVALIWIDERGRLFRSDLARSSGDVGIDNAFRHALSGVPVLPEPPSGMPLPLKLRFTFKEAD